MQFILVITEVSQILLKISYSSPVASAFQDKTSAKRDILFHYINSEAAARQDAAVAATKTKQASAWKLWTKFLCQIRLTQSEYLVGFTHFQRNIIMSAFAQALQECAFST